MKHAFSILLLSIGCGCAGRLEAAKVLYAGTSNGLYKSTDSGASWQLAIHQIPGAASIFGALAIAVDPSNASRIYVADTGVVNGALLGTVHISNDAGQTWSTANMPQNTQFFAGMMTVTVDPAQTSNVYIGCPTGFCRSSDSGQTWTRSVITTYVYGLSTDPKQPGFIFATTQAGFFKSTDFGVTFVPAPPKLDQNSNGFGTGFTGNVLFNHLDRVMYAPVGSTCVSPAFKTSTCGLFKSTDGGTTWTNLNQEGWYKNVTVDLHGGALYAGGQVSGLAGHVIKSVDGGATWTTLDSGITSTGIEVFVDPDDGSILYGKPAVGNPFNNGTSGIYISRNGGASWKLQSVGSVTFDNSTTDLAVESLATVAAGPPPASNLLSNVSAATGQSGPVAVESIVTAVGTRLATGSASADLDPPVTALGGTTVTLTDAAGATIQAPLFAVSPTQVSYQIPPGTALGTATVNITAADGSVTTGQLQITDVAPGVFTLNGSGLVKAYVLRISGSNQFIEDVYQVDTTGTAIPRPVTISNGDQVYLFAYGTGFRAAGTGGVAATIGGLSVPVLYAGPQGTETGVDQFNILIPPELAVAGPQVVQIVLTAGSQTANTGNLTVR